MTAAKTPSQRGRASRNKGAAFERAVTTTLRPWFPDVRRSRDNGSTTTTDTGDLVDAGPFWWSLKDDKSGDLGTPSVLAGWQTEAVTKAGTALVPIIVQKRRGHSDVLRSWTWLRLDDLVHFASGLDAPTSAQRWTRMELGDVLEILVGANYALDPQHHAAVS